MVSKTIVPPGTVGSNPTPSAHFLGHPRGASRFARGAVAVTAIAAVALAACADDGSEGASTPDTAAETAAEPPYDVTTREMTFVDQDRDRTLVTTIHAPVGAPPVPLIAFSHGYDGHPRKFSQLFTAWAEAGYVVAAPAFPLTNDEAPGPSIVSDVANQPADVRFVIDEVLALNDDPDDALSETIDPNHIGAAGLSLGGWTTYGISYNSCCRDERIDAVITMSAIFGGFDGGVYDVSGLPLMIIYGTADPIAAGSPDMYVEAAPPKYLVTITGGTHAAPFEDDPAPADDAVRSMTIDFWNAYLAEQPSSFDQLVRDAQVPGLTELEFDEGPEPRG
jgi:predicted dienelactone hydrolase